MQTKATFSVVISTKNRWRASKLATDSSLKFPGCRLVTNEQYITSSRVMNHVIAANQPLHWLRLFYDITSEKSCILFVQPAMSKNRTILSLYQRIGAVPSGRSTSCRALAAEPVWQNANGTYDIEANGKPRGLRLVEYKYSRSYYVALILGLLTIAYIIMTMRVFIRNISGGDSSR